MHYNVSGFGRLRKPRRRIPAAHPHGGARNIAARDLQRRATHGGADPLACDPRRGARPTGTAAHFSQWCTHTPHSGALPSSAAHATHGASERRPRLGAVLEAARRGPLLAQSWAGRGPARLERTGSV
eukprot:2827634-Prymnesium_polylepis.1